MGEDQEYLRQLLTRLDDITEIKVQMGILTTTVAQLVESQKSVVTAVNGNGKPGLRIRYVTWSSALTATQSFAQG